jgi:NADH:ubiquinone oxidoreductase subunit 3 (subunit A)
MAKSKSSKKSVALFSCCSFVAAVVAILMMLLPAYVVKTSNILGGKGTNNYSLFQITFGELTYDSNGNKAIVVGLLIAFILIILVALMMIAAAVLAYSGSKKNVVALISALAFVFAVAAGVLFFMTLKLADLSTGTIDLYVVKGTGSMGAGIFLAGGFAVVSGLLALVAALKGLLK